MFGITVEKLFVIVVFAALVIGPARLPGYAQRAADLVRGLRGVVRAARAQAEADMGVSLDAARWRQLDPRRALHEAFEHVPEADAGWPTPDSATTERPPAPRYAITGSSAHPRRVLVTSADGAPTPETRAAGNSDEPAPPRRGDPRGVDAREQESWAS